MTSEAHIFFRSIRNFTYIAEMQKKIEKMFCNFEIIAIELVALNTLFY